ncbi:GMC family oxidoreductase [Skermania sp. ID1734]|uniref:GMC family oxidoreductase n=1 Tax=Skermania sp. ID1734 TaxID=2597516 RepID=UPI00117E0F91|nr:GMC family oxidoreductase [Skermania sp. ID1734]TSD93662.1 GMC family oxidoreductase [Skermania sp. ID1734]
MAAPEDESYDFIVVGSGAGGGPLAANLALAGHRVLLLEAGDDHSCRYYSIPIMQAYASEDADMRWDFYVRHWDDATQQARDSKFVPDRDGIWYPRGSTLGGSTAISAMVTIYPHPSDWDRLADLTGDPSWGAAAMREHFRRIERWRGKDAEPMPGQNEADRDERAAHGYDGWLGTTRARPDIGGREPMFLDIIGAIEETARERLGISEDVPLPRDPNALDAVNGGFEGMAFIPVAVADGERNGSRERIRQALDDAPGKLTVALNCLATRVLFDGMTAVGVEYIEGQNLYRAQPKSVHTESLPPTRTVHARVEVILAGGAYNTPQLLMLSGVGPRAELESLGVKVIHNLPGVGRNLHDRYEVSVVTELSSDYPIFEDSSLDVPVDASDADALFVEWRDHRDGPYTTNGSLAALIARSSVATDDPDLIVFALPIDFRGYYPGYSRAAVAHKNRLSILVLKGHTTNRAGTVTLRSADPRDAPEIRFHYFDEGTAGFEADVAGVVDGIEIARDIAGRLGAAVAAELIPGPDASTRDDLADFVRDEAWGHHACGTTKIGSSDDPMAVVDGDFRVYGVNRLRVVDAGVFPDIPGFFIASAVYMISEKASELLIRSYAENA